MKFRFKLQTVLDVKETWLKQKEDEILKLRNKLEDQEKVIQDVLDEIELCEKEINEDDKFSPEELAFKYEYYHDLFNKLKFEKIKKAEIEEEIEQKRLELIEQSKEIKVLEKLKDKEFTNYKKTMETEYQKLLDELAIIQNNRAI